MEEIKVIDGKIKEVGDDNTTVVAEEKESFLEKAANWCRKHKWALFGTGAGLTIAAVLARAWKSSDENSEGYEEDSDDEENAE